MRTLTGYEAIEVAESLDLLLFDLYYKSEITVEQAKQFIQQQRDPESFVLENWPETEKEADQIVLGLFHTALITQQIVEASIADLWKAINQPRTLHPAAAEFAAQRLVEQQALEVIEEDEDNLVYRIPRTLHFTDQFLESLRSVVCEDCAHLNPDKPFHKTCLLALIDFLIHEDFSLDDVTEVRADAHGGRIPNILKSGVSARWLSQTVETTKSRWRSVVKPLFTREQPDDPTIAVHVQPKQEQSIAEHTGQNSATADGAREEPSVIGTRNKISKEELIRYLRSVEILDEDGELAHLRAQRDDLLKQVQAKEREIRQIERQRSYLEGQCEEMQRDMDTLLQAMQIAKRRGHNPTQIIDAEIGSEHDSR